MTSSSANIDIAFIKMTALWDYENWLLSKYDTRNGSPVGME